MASQLQRRPAMPSKSTIRKARQDAREGKAPTTQAGEFVHEEIDHIRAGKHGARNTKQAIAIGLSKARRAGVKLPPPKKGTTSEGTRRKAAQDTARGTTRTARAPAPRRSRATKSALQREGQSAASPQALSRQAKRAASKRKRGAVKTPKRAGARPTPESGRPRRSPRRR